MYEINVSRVAAKSIKRLDRSDAARVMARIAELAENPRPPGCLKLKGFADLWRIRVGDYRVIYSIEDEVLTVQVIRVRHRRDAYE